MYRNIIEFVLCWHLLLGMDLPLSVVYIPNEALLDKTHFSSASGCQLVIASWLGMGALIHVFLSVLGPHLAETCVNLVHAATVPASSHVH